MPPLPLVIEAIAEPFHSPYIYAAFGISILALLFAYFGRPRRIYFVRHGETEANVKRVRQGAEGSLSALGREQARAAAEYLARFPIKNIVSSPQERAAETARIIQERLGAPLSFSPILVERRNPSEVVGKSENDPQIRRIMDQVDRIYHADDYRYSDEENFTDLKARAKKCVALLARQSERHMLAVTHSIFLKMVIAYLLYRDDLHASDYVKLSFYNASDNAGITIVEYRPWHFLSRTRGWRIVEYNVTPYAGGRGGEGSAPPRIPPPVS